MCAHLYACRKMLVSGTYRPKTALTIHIIPEAVYVLEAVNETYNIGTVANGYHVTQWYTTILLHSFMLSC